MTVRAEDVHFEVKDWGLLLSLSAIWGSSFLLTAIALDAFEPGLVTLFRVGFGALTLAGLPGVRGKIPRRDLAKMCSRWLHLDGLPAHIVPRRPAMD